MAHSLSNQVHKDQSQNPKPIVIMQEAIVKPKRLGSHFLKLWSETTIIITNNLYIIT